MLLLYGVHYKGNRNIPYIRVRFNLSFSSYKTLYTYFIHNIIVIGTRIVLYEGKLKFHLARI